jgi:SPP1 family predicted phage head-tail adaptor
VQRSAEVQDGTGFPVPAWSFFARVWGDVRPLRARELVEARQVHERVDTVIRVRPLPGLDSRMRVLYAERDQALAAAVGTVDGTSITVAEAWPGAGPFRVEIDTELMEVSAGSAGTAWTVVRGVDGSTAALHADGAQVRRLTVYEIEGPIDVGGRRREVELAAVGQERD